ncbi:MAG: lysozyme [Desulfobacterales bacterium]|nr:lysozyme [Desulfobacterales bacterium]
MLIRHEGFRLKPYRCSAGKLTVGVGKNLDASGFTEPELQKIQTNGITEKQAYEWLDEGIAESIHDLRDVFSEFDQFSDSLQLAFIDMRFNLGRAGFLKFKKLIEAIRNNDFITAATEMQQSRWFSQVGNRAKEVQTLVLHNMKLNTKE